MSTLNLDGIKTEGGLLPAELLQRISALDRELPGLAATDYDILGHERVLEAAGRAWTRLVPAYQRFREALAAAADAQHTSITRQRWLLPLFQELGYGRLEPARLEHDGQRVPISHAWAATPIHLLGWDTSLDTRTARVAGAAKASPHGLVQDFLNKSDGHLWGLVSNGQVLRILRDHLSLTRQAFVEFDLEQIFDAERYASFLTLWLVAHESRLRPRQRPATLKAKAERASDADADDEDLDEESDDVEEASPDLLPSECWLERWHKLGLEQGIRAHKQLRVSVKEAIELLGTGFLAHRDNARLRAELASGALDAQSYYRHVLRLVYRLIFLFAAEDRGLLLDTDASETARERYRSWYSTQRLRNLARTVRGGPHGDAWRGLRRVMALLGVRTGPDGKVTGGEAALALPALGSWLWDDTQALGVLATSELSNQALFRAVRRLSLVRDESRGRGAGVQYPVDWRHIGADELGSVYESLLELRPDIDNAEGRLARFVLNEAAGNERKTTGSYYTPESLVSCLLDTALDPVVDRARAEDDPKKALLALKVCDPACGSGHFLVAAGRRIARAVAQVETGDLEPSPVAVQSAMREVVGHCLFGVDLNPMAVELCKVSLWMEGMQPGRPLSFLDHHIQCGNALLGATPALLSRGIPDDAFAVLEGDDKRIVSDLKKRNKQERRRRTQGTEQFALGFGDSAQAPTSLASRASLVEAIADDSLGARRSKERAWTEFAHSAVTEQATLVANAWCAAFVWPKDRTDVGTAALTEQGFRDLTRGRTPSTIVRATIAELADDYQFFHWHLAFPQVFGAAEGPFDDDATTGWPGGFDVVLGNPPWERIKLQEKEFFTGRHDGIANARNAAERKRAIARLPDEDPTLWQAWCAALRRANGESHIVRSSGRYPLCGRGDINTYAIFAELNRDIPTSRGRAGFIVPSGIATDATTQYYFRALVDGNELSSLFHFENEDRVFPGVHHAFRFVLFTIDRSKESGAANLVFYARQVVDLSDSNRHFSLSAAEFAAINPNTKTCPTFRWRRDAEIAKGIYDRVPVLWREDGSPDNPWEVTFQAMLHMANDSGLFRDADALRADGFQLDGNVFRGAGASMLPLYEAKMFHHFDHRFGTYAGQTDAQARQGKLPEATDEMHSDSGFVARPRYWVPASEVDIRVEGWPHSWLLSWRNIARSADQRSCIGCILPLSGVAHSASICFIGASSEHLATQFVANISSLVFDYVARQKLGGANLSYFILKQLPVLPPARYGLPAPWRRSSPLSEWLRDRVLELTYTAWDLRPFALDCGCEAPPFVWDEARRFLLRCELDAAFFHLYGIGRDDVDYIMETFPVVRRKDEKTYDGDYRTKRVILGIYDAMQTAIDSGAPYQTRLDPPPADPRCTHSASTRPEARRGALVVPDGTPPPGPYEPHALIWAFLRANGDRMARLELARAFSLLAQPESMTRHARGTRAETAQTWASRVNHSRFPPGAFRAALDELVSRHGVAYSPDGRTVTTTEDTAPAERLGDWPIFEARLALAVLAEMPAEELEEVDAQLSDDDKKVVRLRGA